MNSPGYGPTENRVLALAAVFQAAWQVEQIATRGRSEPGAFDASIGSIFQLSPDTTAGVFGGPAQLRLGLELLAEALGGSDGVRSPGLLRYVINLLQLERSFSRNREMGEIVRARLQQVGALFEEHGAGDATVLSALDTVYQDTISKLSTRIQVQGESMFLRNDDHVHRIRALLLAGLRAAVLWRQKGGNRWQLLFNRGRMLRSCRHLLDA